MQSRIRTHSPLAAVDHALDAVARPLAAAWRCLKVWRLRALRRELIDERQHLQTHMEHDAVLQEQLHKQWLKSPTLQARVKADLLLHARLSGRILDTERALRGLGVQP